MKRRHRNEINQEDSLPRYNPFDLAASLSPLPVIPLLPFFLDWGREEEEKEKEKESRDV